MTHRQRRRRSSRPTRLLRLLLATIVVASTAAFAVIAVGQATGRFRLAPVLSGSMNPTFPTGALVMAEPIPSDDLRVGDVLLFNAPIDGRPLVMHRVVAMEHRKGQQIIKTKGDANDAPDTWTIAIKSARAWRVVHSVPYVGTTVGWVGTPAVRMVVLVGGVVLMLLQALKSVWTKRPIAWHDDERDSRRTVLARHRRARRFISIGFSSVITLGALGGAALAGARFTATPKSPTPPVERPVERPAERPAEQDVERAIDAGDDTPTTVVPGE